MFKVTSITNDRGIERRRAHHGAVLVVASMLAAACASSDLPADAGDAPSTSARPAATTSTALAADAAVTVETAPAIDTSSSVDSTTAPPTSVRTSRSTPPIPLGEDDRVFYAGWDTVIVAHAPDPWEPFPVPQLGMRRDLGTAEWVGISFWEPWEVPTDSCRWEESWEDAGESVADLADALGAVSLRNPTAPVPVTVGGYDGLYMEWSLPDDLDITTCDDETTVAWTGAAGKTRSHSSPGLIDRMWILDVEGRRILIDVLSRPLEQDLIRDRIDEVIASLRLAPSRR